MNRRKKWLQMGLQPSELDLTGSSVCAVPSHQPFFEKTQKTLRFFSLNRKEVSYNHPRTSKVRMGYKAQCTSHEGGRTTLRPAAPALAQEPASSLIRSTSVPREGVALSKTQLFLCFQTSHGTRSATDCRALRCARGVSCLACCHQSMRVGS